MWRYGALLCRNNCPLSQATMRASGLAVKMETYFGKCNKYVFTALAYMRACSVWAKARDAGDRSSNINNAMHVGQCLRAAIA